MSEALNRYAFEVLAFLERRGFFSSVREVSDELRIAGSTVEKALEALTAAGLVDDGKISASGLAALEPYRVKRAIIVAAGFGSRMMPATQDRPKPLVRVNGVRIIDTLLDALVGVGITDIVIVGGYRFEAWQEILGKYPFVRLLENRDYASTNNISSAMTALEYFRDGCYFCEADLFITNPGIIPKYQYASNILGAYVTETDDWCYKSVDGYLSDYRKGNTYCWNYYGISYWTPEDCDRLRADLAAVYAAPDGKDYFWEFIPFVLRKDRYRVEIRPCRKQDIMEIDNYSELCQLDESYKK